MNIVHSPSERPTTCPPHPYSLDHIPMLLQGHLSCDLPMENEKDKKLKYDE